MKKIILISILAIAVLINHETLKAQITLIHTYDSATTNLYIVNLEIEGQKYIYRDLFFNHRIILYNLDHSIFKIMPFPSVSWGTNPSSILYVSEHLFNSDDSIEYMLVYTLTNPYHTVIANESGTILFSGDSLAPLVQSNEPQTQQPIYNTPNGTIMILSNQLGTGVANVYSLTGTLTNSIQPINNTLGNQMMENIYPNPSNGNTTIEFNLPQGVNTGQLVIYNMQGVELKSYKVDNTFHTLLLNNSEFHAGTYFYQLITTSGASGAKKMIVIH
jgi:hypothetical protein